MFEAMSSTAWEPGADPVGWWMSRAVSGQLVGWHNGRLVSPEGTVVEAPRWLVRHLPDEPLVIELKARRPNDWLSTRLHIFDVANRNLTLEKRLFAVRQMVAVALDMWRGDVSRARHSPVQCPVVAVDATRCVSRQHFDDFCAQHGNVLLRRSGSMYVTGPSIDMKHRLGSV